MKDAPVKLTIEPTEHFFVAGDVMVRMWQGTAEDGTQAVVMVTAVCTPGQAEAIAEGLVSIPPPDAEAAKQWAQKILDGAPREPTHLKASN
jgi:hypothetical protein